MSDNIFVYNESSSEYETSSEEEQEKIIENSEFMNNTSVEEYLKNRNTIFTKDIETVDILIEKKLDPSDTFTSSNKFYFSNSTSSGKTYKNVIDVSLLKGFIKSGTNSNIIKIHVNNIPHRACIQNPNELNIIDVIALNNGVASTAGTTMVDSNYFFPIEIDHLDINFSYVDTEPNIDFFTIVFRLTMVKNLNLLK